MQYGLDLHAQAERRSVVVERLDVAVMLDGGEVGVGHAELFALVDVRRPLCMCCTVARLGGILSVLGAVVAEPRHRPRLIMVVPIQRVPADIGKASCHSLRFFFNAGNEREPNQTCRCHPAASLGSHARR